MLALLAFACFPALAQAETVYETEPTNLPNEVEKAPTHHKNLEEGESSPQASSSGTPGGGQGSQPQGPGSSKTENQASQESNPSTSGGGPQGSGNGGADSQSQAGGGLQKAEPVSHSTESSGEGGSSSPLVPILIAVAVLAAISVGAVLVRQRRASDGGVSPKAS